MSGPGVTGATTTVYSNRVMRSLVVQLAMRSASIKQESWKERVSILGLASMSNSDGHRCMQGTPEQREGFAREFMESLAKGLLNAAQRGEWSEDFKRVVAAGSQMAAISPSQGADLFLQELAKALRTHVTVDMRAALIGRAVEATANANNLLTTLLQFAEERGLSTVGAISAMCDAFTDGISDTVAGVQEFQALVTESLMRARIAEMPAHAGASAPSAARRRRMGV